MGLMYPQTADYLREAAQGYNVRIVEWPDWQRNGRPGGFARVPVAVVNHHTAHAATTFPGLDAILDYEANKFGENPDGSLYPGNSVHARFHPGGWGELHVLAAGPTATNGQGIAVTLPGGETIPKDSANSWTITCEVQNPGTGRTYERDLVDALLVFDVGVLRMLEKNPRNIIQHHTISSYRGKSCLAHDNLEGPFQPRAEANGITWLLEDVRDEAERRFHNQGDWFDMATQEDLHREFLWLVRHEGRAELQTAVSDAVKPLVDAHDKNSDLNHEGTHANLWGAPTGHPTRDESMHGRFAAVLSALETQGQQIAALQAAVDALKA